MPSHPREQDRIKRLIEHAWLLSETDIAHVTPTTPVDQLEGLISLPVDAAHPLRGIGHREIQPEDLIRIMRDPNYFPFTCKLLMGIDIMPFQHVILRELWTRPFPMLIGSRGLGKSFILALYSMLRLVFTQGSKVAVIGASFRQSKVIFEYMEKVWADGAILRDLCGTGKGRAGREQGPRRDVDRCEMIIGDSVGIAIPLGNGEKIRGQRANYIVVDEFASVPEDIYQNVVRGFASVSADPASGVRHQARVQLLKKLGQWTEEDNKAEARTMRSNQNIISGTAYYSFNHFYKTWKTYKAFIESCGDRKKLEEIFDGPVPEGFDWRDFSIIRIPVDMLPRGFMDEKQISSARATLSKSNYMIEFGASFATDSEGFFKRSLIESCVVGRPDNPIVLNEETVEFSASLVGDDVPHVIAVDPASERDHFSVVVLALYSDHRRLVHCWTTNRKSHKERLKRGVVKEQNFYAFCARKLRELMLAFPNVEVLGIDSQGGGVTVEESLHDLEKLKDGEMPLWREIDSDPKKYKDSDGKPGLHIIRMINFADARWIVDANHGLRKDLEDKVLLLPAFDTAALGLAYEEDKAAGRIVLEDGEEISLYDTLEDAVVDIEELKDELASIVHTATAGGRDRWDVPGAKLPGSKAGKQRKDRYSALLMANAIARDIQRTEAPQEYHPVGGFAADIKDADGDLYIGPSWFVEATRGDYGAAVGRDGVELADPTA